ncbi:MAG: LamG-like jellyroll fold domain-containing protein [Anaerolineales bacterium]
MLKPFLSSYWFRLSFVVCLIITVVCGLSPARPSQAQSAGYSLRFYGHGINDIDRIKIRIDPQVPADVGATDFTLEWWMKANPGDNTSQNVSCGSNDGWITGNIIFDRDIYWDGDYGDFGIALSGGRLAFGVNNGSTGATLCGNANVTDGQWHHIAATRNRSTGQLRMVVDGQLDSQSNGPTGDVSYRNGRSGQPHDPYLVIGAEKHDAGSAYPSYRGWIDEVRLSTTLRYTANFTRPSTPFSADANTVALYHLEEGPAGACQNTVNDSASGGASAGTCRYGGSAPAGPVYTTDTPFGTGSPTNTPTRTQTPVGAPTSTRTPTPAATTPFTATPPPSGNFGLSFDGVNDLARAAQVIGVGPLTVEVWARPAVSNANGLVVVGGDDATGWSLEINNGQLSFWLATDQGWQVVQHSAALQAGQWVHLAATYASGSARVFVNGNAAGAQTVGVLTQGPHLYFGGLSGYQYFAGVLDEVRLSNVARYTGAFTPPASFSADGNTLGLWRFNAGSGQTAQDSSSAANHATLGASSGSAADDPAWMAVSR